MKNLQKKNILFLINVDAYFKQLFPLILHLKQETRLNPVLYFPLEYPSVSRHTQECQKYEIEHILAFELRKNMNTVASVDSLIKINFKKYLINIPYLRYLLTFFIGFRKRFQYFCQEQKEAKKILLMFQCKLLILGGDNIGHNTDIFIKVFHQFRIRSIILPGWMASPLEAFQANKYNLDVQVQGNVFNKLCAKLNKKLVYEYDGQSIIRWPIYEYFVRLLFGLIPPEPWLLHSGYSDLILVESNAMKEYMMEEGLNSIPIEITGSMHHDIMNKILLKKENFVNKIFENYNFDKEKKLCLVSLPPNMLYGSGRPECEFEEFNDLVNAFLSAITQLQSYNVIISLHPSISQGDINSVLQINNLIVSYQNITDLIPLCDIFVASISSTIQWAISCSKPVINYDVYKYKYTDYNDVKGVVYVDNQFDYIQILKKFQNEEYYNKVCYLQSLEALDWGKLDGNCVDRIMRVIRNMVLN